MPEMVLATMSLDLAKSKEFTRSKTCPVNGIPFGMGPDFVRGPDFISALENGT